jgi:crotonobetainyl-CoA:carnitine CoA-transferase CaiB-like acyl-CoA transferase
VVVPALLPVLSRTPGRTTWAGPHLGQHTDQILREVLGMSAENIAELQNKGAI